MWTWYDTSMKIRILVAVLAVSCFLGIAVPTHASAQESIRKFDTKTTITRSNTANITETIVYDFGTTSRHGIYRDIPIDYTDGHLNYYLNFSLGSVSDETGNRQQTETSTVNGNKRIRIGDPDRTITGIHTYVITYTLSPIIIDKSGTPFLNLDVVGEGWQVPIYDISAQVLLEDGSSLSDITWYGGVNQSSSAASYAAPSLPAYSGVTINASLPASYLNAPYLKPNTLRSEDVASMVVATLVGVVVGSLTLAVVIVFILRAARTRARRKAQIVVAQYEPPAGTTPAHIGFLQDDAATNREITATIIDWAVAGYIKIEYIPKKGLFSSTDYRLVQTGASTRMSPAETELYNAIFSEADELSGALLSKLPKASVASAATSFKSSLKADLSSKGYYDKDGNILNIGELTDEGAKQWALVDGFKLYLSVVEKDRLKFTDAPKKTPERFSKLLPYAIALGVEKEWAKQFEGIDLAQATNWYSGNLATFSAVALVSDLGSSFASTVASNSSVTSSGGSSGGGFGGGGGGSW